MTARFRKSSRSSGLRRRRKNTKMNKYSIVWLRSFLWDDYSCFPLLRIADSSESCSLPLFFFFFLFSFRFCCSESNLRPSIWYVAGYFFFPMASSFGRWEKDPFFSAADEVQESADRYSINVINQPFSISLLGFPFTFFWVSYLQSKVCPKIFVSLLR